MTSTHQWRMRGKDRWVSLFIAVFSVTGFFHPAAAQTDPGLVGQWAGEYLVEGADIHIRRWTIDRRADGSYSVRRFKLDRDGVHEASTTGQWRVKDGLLHLEEQNGTAYSGAWRYGANGADCIDLQAVDASTGTPLKPAERFGECRQPFPRAIPDEVHRRCIVDPPGSTSKGVMDIRIVLGPDGLRYASYNDKQMSRPVEVRDYPVLRDFDPRRPDSMTNAGEALLVLVQSSTVPRLGFDPRSARSVRVYVLEPPRAHRLLEFFNAGKTVLFEAVGEQGQSLGMSMYMPFLLACPAAPH